MASEQWHPAPGGKTPTDSTRMGTSGTTEGHTPERSAADQYGNKGTPAAGLSPAVPHAADVHEMDHSPAHAEAPPGPVDWAAWAVGALGVAAGGLMALVLVLAIQHG